MKRILAGVSIFLLAACAHVAPASNGQLFDALDDNHDGIVTIEELGSEDLVVETEEDGHKEVHQPDGEQDAGSASTMTFEQKRRLLEDIDQNRDGTISRPEWNRASPDGYMLWKF